MKRVLIIGATGQFGSRLASLLCEEPAFEPILGGRTAARLAALADQLGGREWLAIDRATLSGAELRADNVSGPHVPVLPALATLRALATSRIGAGARSCTGFLTLDDFAADFARLGITTGIEPFIPRAADRAR